ncbi:hypothetical protein JQS43_22990 [Natronosporangium hydrolyticum]|uniref:TPR repeat domain-containing protein n=1 Tax=Natronosporangium hydrolyticum TaxID=2811111 RepID=A0A895YFT3_9ACTN|nr:hypothetical protein [Natronosporangium hydrolyticum]QSB14329.1 hypothetical protein JQS43_22990 [Natronosporangium hydrolyticum]
MTAIREGGRSGGVAGEFDPYPVSAFQVWLVAEAVSQTGGDVERLGDDVSGAHQPAQQGVAGLLAVPMVAAERPIHDRVRRWLASAVFAGGAIRWFGDAIHDYDQGIEGLNQRWRDAQASDFGVSYDPPTPPDGFTRAYEEAHAAELSHARRQLWLELETDRVSRLESTLDDIADRVARMLAAGPDDEDSVLMLFQAGALPIAAPVVFGSVDFSKTDPELLYRNLLRSGRLPDVDAMTEDELFAWLKDHPAEAELLSAALLLPGELSAADKRVVKALARYDAWHVERGLGLVAGSAGLALIGSGSQRLAGINTQLAAGDSLSPAQRTYLHAWYDGVGADNLAALDDYVTQATYAEMAGLPADPYGSVAETRLAENRDRFLAPVADGIMNLSNPQLGGTDDLAKMPRAIQDLVTIHIGGMDPVTGAPVDEFGLPVGFSPDLGSFTVAGLDQYNGFASLLSRTTVLGGDEFTLALGESALRVKEELAAIEQQGLIVMRPRLVLGMDEPYQVLLNAVSDDSGASTMLSLVARNQDVATTMLIGDDDDDDLLPRLLGARWYDDQGAIDILGSGTARTPDGVAQAEAAMKVMQEVGGRRSHYLFTMTEGLEDAVIDVGIVWMDTFGHDSHPRTDSAAGMSPDVLSRDSQAGIYLSADDRDGFLEFIAASGEGQAARFRAASVVYSEELLVTALTDPGTQSVESVLRHIGRLDGAISAADFNVVMEQSAHRDVTETMAAVDARRAGGVALAAEVALSAVGAAGSVKSGGISMLLASVADPLVSSAIDELFPSEDEQGRSNLEQAKDHAYNDDRLSALSQRNYLMVVAYDRAGLLDRDDPSIQSLYGPDGNLKTYQELLNNENILQHLMELEDAQDSGANQAGLDANMYDQERDRIHNGSWTSDRDGDRVYG